MLGSNVNQKCDLFLNSLMHICVSRLVIIGSDNGLSLGRRQAIIWTNAGILLIGPWGTNFSEISIKILTFSFTKMHLKVSSGKWWPFCLGLNVLIDFLFVSGEYTLQWCWQLIYETGNNVFSGIWYFIAPQQIWWLVTDDIFLINFVHEDG